VSELVGPGSKYTDEDRRAAALSYAVHGIMSKVSRSLGIAETTLSLWKKSDWWESLTDEVRTEKQDIILAGLSRIAEKAISETEDRLDNGDVYVSQGQITRAPVKAKEAMVIGAVALDKRQLLSNQPTTIRGDSSDMQALAKKFEELSRQHKERVVSEQ
jgi:hypothetical protein